MPWLGIVAAVVQSDEALNLKGALGSVSLVRSTELSKRFFIETTCSAESLTTAVLARVQVEKVALTIVPARNESPTTEPCQPVARSQPGPDSATKGGVICAISRGCRTCNVAEILLRPWRGELGDPVILASRSRGPKNQQCQADF